MSTESKDFDPYAIVLADLRAQRDRIDQAIQAIESVRGGVSASQWQAPSSNGNHPAQEDGAFLGMSISEATKKLLQMRKKAINNTAILAELRAGGLVLTANDPLNTIGAVLSRRFNDIGDIVRVDRGTWGLKEWYPGRNFAKTPVKGTGEEEVKPAKSSPSVNELPSRPAFDDPQE